MTIKKYREYFINSLEDLYPIEELQSIFYLLASKYLNLSRIDIALQLDDTLTSDEEINFNQAIDRLKIYEPVQYILEETEFFWLSVFGEQTGVNTTPRNRRTSCLDN